MTSVQIVPGSLYSIQSPFVNGGFLQFASATTGPVNATFGTSVTSLSQQWIFQPTDATNTTVTIRNAAIDTSYITAAPGSSLLISNSRIETWYLSPVGAVYHSICYNVECTLVWAPWARVGGPLTSNEVLLSPSVNATGSELWRILPANATTRAITEPTTPTVAAVPISTTTSEAAYIPSGSSTSYTVPDQTAQRSKELSALSSCPPCGKSKCEFTPSDTSATTEDYSVLIGQPVANCVVGNSETVKTTLGGTFELEHSFSVDQSIGSSLGLIVPATDTTKSSSSTKTVRSQSVEISIPPGQMGGLVANISYYFTRGRMKIDDRTLPFVQLDPDNIMSYSVLYVTCGSTFPAITLPKAECLVSAAPSLKSVCTMCMWLVLTVFMSGLGLSV